MFHLGLANGDVYVLSVSVPQLEKVIAADVGHEIAKGTVGGDHLRRSGHAHRGGGPQDRAGLTYSPPTQVQHSSSRHRGPGVLRPGKKCRVRGKSTDKAVPIIQSRFVILAHRFDPVAVLASVINPLSGRTKYWPRFVFTTTALLVLPTPGVDDRHKHRARREIGTCAIEEAGAIEYGERRDLMGEIHDAQLGRNRVHHAFAERYGIVHHAEIGHEDDGRRGWRHALSADRQIGDAKTAG